MPFPLSISLVIAYLVRATLFLVSKLGGLDKPGHDDGINHKGITP
jgi:hypothetical protein